MVQSAYARQLGESIEAECVGLGSKAEVQRGLGMSALGGKAEVDFGRLKVRF